MSPLRILQVVHSFPPHNIAGTEVYACNLSCALAKRHSVFVFHRINDKKKHEFELAYTKDKELHIYAVNNTLMNCDSFEMLYDNKIITSRFERLLDEINPDIVHLQHLLFLSIGIVTAAKRRNIPVVFTLNDYWLLCPQGQLLYKDTAVCKEPTISKCIKCRKYQLSLKKGIMHIHWSLRGRCPIFLIQIMKEIYFIYARLSFLSRGQERRQIELREKSIKQMCAKIDIFLAPSEFLRKKFVDFGIPQNKIVFLPLGLNQSYFKNPEENPQRGKVCFAFIGTLLPSKGVHVLLHAFNRIKNKSIELKIYGREVSYKGFEYYLKYVKKIARHKGIHFMGGYNNEDIANIFSGIDVLVMPAIWYENSPLVIQEAFLAKKPVIASRIGGIPELVDDGKNGLLFNAGDIGNLQEKMQYVIDNPDFLREAETNMPVVEDMQSHAAKIEMFYNTLLSKRVNYEPYVKGMKE